jgi:dTDP-4-amino-4,6-dideoxygalactose transaminase
MKNNIQFCDLNLPSDSETLIWQKAKQVIHKNAYILGDEVNAFENEFAEYCDTTDCIGVATGCDALLWTMEALGIGKGDEVITVANTFIGTILPIIRSGATPVLVDCDPITQQIAPQAVDAAITRKTAAIVAVHLYGRLAPMDELMAISEKHGLLLLEDAAQAHGARYKGKRVGSMGTAAGFSFYPAKNLGAWGDGGAVTTNERTLAEKIGRMINYGQVKKYHHAELGWNSRLDTLQSVVLSEKLKLLDEWNVKRRIAASWYYELLKDEDVTTYHESTENEAVHHLFVVTLKDREKMIEKLSNAGIPTGIHYPVPIHNHECFKDYTFTNGKHFPIAEEQASELLSLPMHPNLKEGEVEKICETIKNHFSL